MQGFAGHQDQVFALTEGVIRTLTPISDQGPFRVRLLGIDYQRRLSYVPGGGDLGAVPPPPRPAFRAGQQRAPGWSGPAQPGHDRAVHRPAPGCRRAAACRWPRAASFASSKPLDDHGNSLIPIRAAKLSRSTTASYFGAPHGPVMETHAQLQRPADPGETIKKLRGTIPVTVSARRPGPLIVPLEKSAGKTFENSDIQLTVHSVRTLPDSRHTLVELSIRPMARMRRRAATPRATARSSRAPATSSFKSTCSTRNDRLMPWFQSIADAESSHVTLTLTSSLQSAPPKELRYYSVARTDVDIPFEFSGMPMP